MGDEMTEQTHTSLNSETGPRATGARTLAKGIIFARKLKAVRIAQQKLWFNETKRFAAPFPTPRLANVRGSQTVEGDQDATKLADGRPAGWVRIGGSLGRLGSLGCISRFVIRGL